MIEPGRPPIDGGLAGSFDRRSLLRFTGVASLVNLTPSSRGRASARAETCQHDGCLVRQWGSGWGPPGRLSYPKALALDPDGSLYVIDAGHDQIQKFTPDGQFLAEFRIPGTETVPMPPRRELVDLAAHPSRDVYVIDVPNEFALILPDHPTPDRVVRFTGDGEFVQEWGGTGSAPGLFIHPTGIAVDRDGAILVADAGNGRIQKFAPDGTVLDVWGSEGQTVGARATPVAVERAPGQPLFTIPPLGIAVVPDGTILVTIGGAELRGQRFASDGTFLGHWPPGIPIGAMAFDRAGNVYVVRGRINTEPPQVRVFSPEGEVLRGWEVPDFPSGIAVDALGDVYLTLESGLLDAPLLKFDGEGRLLASWGGSNRAPGELDHPQGIAADAIGNVYVADLGNHRVQRFDGEGTFLDQWTGESLGLGRALWPYDVAVGPGGHIYVLDDVRTIVQVTREGRLVREWPAAEGGGAFHLDVDAQGRVYAAAGCVWVSDPDSEALTCWASAADGITYAEPYSIAIDRAGNVYVSDLRHNVVSQMTTDGRLLATWSGKGVGPAEFLEPLHLAVDAAGNVYIAGHSVIQKLNGDGTLLVSWETAEPQEPGLALPQGVAVDGAGYVYVVERYNNLVKKFAQRGKTI
jgi:DNA-binding beta-propeller fold protein YncE